MVQVPAAAALLGQTAIFGSLAEPDRLAIARHMRAVTYAKDREIFQRGSAGSEIYFVQKGRVRLSVLWNDGRVLTFKNAGAGDFFGEIAALDGGARTADATALTRVEALTLGKTQLDRLIDGNVRVARATIDFLCSRLRDTSEQAEGVALHPVEVRLARFLLSALNLSHSNGSASARLRLGLSQGELAQMIGASRQKVNVAFRALEHRRAIARSREALTCDALLLARICEEGLDGSTRRAAARGD